MIQKGVRLCLKCLPEWSDSSGTIDMIYWFHGTQALFRVGGEPWKAWKVAMKTAIVDHQRRDGDQKGSWDPVGVWGDVGGRICATALMTMCLEVCDGYPGLAAAR